MLYGKGTGTGGHMTYRQHWYRGGTVIIGVALAPVVAALPSLYVTLWLVVGPLEAMGLHPNEDAFTMGGAAISAVAFMPLVVSQFLHRSLLSASLSDGP